MKTRRTIFKALMALLVIILGTNFNAEAQLGGLINAAKNKAKANKEQKAAQEQAKFTKPVIPQPNANGTIVKFTMSNKDACTWNPATLELTLTATNEVIKLDPATGVFKSNTGDSKGLISNDGTIVSAEGKTFKIEESSTYFVTYKEDNKLAGDVENVSNANYQVVSVNQYGSNKFAVIGKTSDKVSALLTAYVYFGLLIPDGRLHKLLYGYDNTQTYTSDQLDDLIEWNDQDAIAEILKYENSLPCAGFKDKHPEFKNCKIGAIGLMSNQWADGTDYYWVDYWVVYELTDGRNIVTFSTARKKFRYGDVENRWRKFNDEFHEVTDWQRK